MRMANDGFSHLRVEYGDAPLERTEDRTADGAQRTTGFFTDREDDERHTGE
jgi:hypothetical protein